MLAWLTRRRKISGGLYFGPAAWRPDHFDAPTTPDESPQPPTPTPQPHPTTRAALTELLHSLHLNATSAITPSLSEQLTHLHDRRIRAIVLNLLPTQPEFALPAALSHLALNEILGALLLLQQIIQPKKIIIALDRHDHPTRRLWKRALRQRNLKFSLVPLHNRYPQAHPTLLLWSLFGKRTPASRLPVLANRIITDPVALWALGNFLHTAQPFTSRPVQLFAACNNETSPQPRLVLARLNESINALCARFNISTANSQVILNGLLAGEEVDPAITPITSSTESITIRQRPTPETPNPCFSCGWCLDVCPTTLNPVSLLDLANHAQSGIESSAVTAQLRSRDAKESLHCIGCGLCSYVCPTRLPLTPQILRLRAWVDAAQASSAEAKTL